MNIFKNFIALSLTIAVALPSFVKLSHTFNHHTHEVCEGDSSLHFHKLDVDCEFYKFKLNNNYEVIDLDIEIFTIEIFDTNLISHKSFLKNKIRLNRFQRGPPFSFA